MKADELQNRVDSSPRMAQQREILTDLPSSPRQLLARHAASTISCEPIQRRESGQGEDGLPDPLKTGIESLSGMRMDHVKVHHNSPLPARLGAHAFAQGSDIHLGPGEQQHLPHEAWHIVQQAQGRVHATRQLKGGVPVNDDLSLEREADIMGERALQMHSGSPSVPVEASPVARAPIVQRRSELSNFVSEIILSDYVDANFEGPPVELMMRMEDECYLPFDAGKSNFSEALAGIRWIVENLLKEEMPVDAFASLKIVAHTIKQLQGLGKDEGFDPGAVAAFRAALSELYQEAESELATMFPFGEFSLDSDMGFWQGEADGALSERLVQTPKGIKRHLKNNTDPALWKAIAKTMESSGTIAREEGQATGSPKITVESKEEAEPVKRRQPGRASVKGREVIALTGAEAGKAFVENVVPLEIGATEPRVWPSNEKFTYTPEILPELDSKNKQPGYVLNMPAHTSKDVQGLLTRYGSGATQGSPNMKARIAAVIGINTRKPIDTAEPDPIKAAIDTARAATADFRFSVVGFCWAPAFTINGVKAAYADVVAAFNALPDDAAKQYAKTNLYDKRSGQKYLPYGIFRQEVAKHPMTNAYVRALAAAADPVYLHIGDPDAISWHTNNNSEVGVLTRYDDTIGQMDRDTPEGTGLPPMIVGGYNFGGVKPADSDAQKLARLGNVLDRAIRRSIARIVPEAMYPTEPNLLVKAADEREADKFAQWKIMSELLTQDGGLFGKADSEGNRLRINLKRTLGREISDATFAPYVDATIETDIPDRIEESARASETAMLNLLKQKQSYTSTENWTSISRTDGPEKKAKASVEKALHKIIKDELSKHGK